jgi:hypothetical protein
MMQTRLIAILSVLLLLQILREDTAVKTFLLLSQSIRGQCRPQCTMHPQLLVLQNMQHMLHPLVAVLMHIAHHNKRHPLCQRRR